MSDLYYKIYAIAHNNAVDLLHEADFLFTQEAYARSYLLAYTALEEISKSQFAADVYTGLRTKAEFRDFYRNHARKLELVQWVHDDANSWPYNIRWVGPDRDDVEEIAPGVPVYEKRLAAMYVDINFCTRTVLKPAELISSKEAKEMIQLVNVAIDRIVITEEDQGCIGTKAFMK